MITDAMLKEAAHELETALIGALPDPKECYHEFSAEFERKMKKVIYRANHPFISKFWQRAAAVVLAILLLGGSVLVISPDARAAFVGWIKEIYESCYHYFVPAPAQEEVPEEIPTAYHPGWLPEGYTLLDSFEIDNGTTMIYVDTQGKILQFSYYINPDNALADLFVEQDTHIYKEVKINGQLADLYISIDGNHSNGIVWSNSRGVLFCISADLEEDNLTSIAENVVPDKN